MLILRHCPFNHISYTYKYKSASNAVLAELDIIHVHEQEWKRGKIRELITQLLHGDLLTIVCRNADK
jgi:hypothetical protein